MNGWVYVLNDWLQMLTSVFLLALMVAVLFVIAVLVWSVIGMAVDAWKGERYDR